jgi:N-acetylmuramoyl-L-alanine amidase
MKTLFKALLITVFSLLLPLGMVRAEKTRDYVVVIDPGHGGKDYGAIGNLTNEKTINLDVALRVKKLLADVPGIKVVMTRSTDVFISLQERANIANRNHGDLFMSIHVNSVDKNSKNRTTVHGSSVYTLGLHRTNSNFEVAKRENSVMELEPDFSTKYEGFNPNSTESYIIFELSQNKHLDQSIKFAQLAQSELTSTGSRANRGVFQAGFWVLHATSMPAALVELDFICNPTSETFMNSSSGKDKMATSLANAIKSYFGKKTEKSGKSEQSEQSEQSELSDNSDSAAVTYRVQFMACDSKLSNGSSEFKGLKNVEYYRQTRLYKYTAGGDFATEAEAEKYASEVVRKKFPQAFVIKWQNGTRAN